MQIFVPLITVASEDIALMLKKLQCASHKKCCNHPPRVLRIMKVFTRHVVRGNNWLATTCSLHINGGFDILIAWLTTHVKN